MTASATTAALRDPPASRAATWARMVLLAGGSRRLRPYGSSRGVGARPASRPSSPRAGRGSRFIRLVLEIAFTSRSTSSRHAPSWGARETAYRTSDLDIRSTALACYAAMTILPAGRAAGEATRAATLAPAIGATHAAAVCARLQVAVLAGNAIVSLAGAAVLALCGRPWSVLGAALAANGVVCGALATALLLVVRNANVARWLRRRFARLVDRYATTDHAPPPTSALVRAIAACALRAGVQTFQYGVVVVAVGGAASPLNALTAQAIHLVGAAVGDAIPGQVGALEGAYRTFAETLGLANDPARALSIALAVRLAQLALAGLGVLVSTFAARTTRATT